MARGRARPLLGMLLGHCVWLAPACAQQVTQCTDIDIGVAQSSSHAFGGKGFCCSWHNDTKTTLCCPGDGTTTYTTENKYCTPDELELQPSALPDKELFLRENVCPPCLQDGTCNASLQLDNIQMQGPQVRSE